MTGFEAYHLFNSLKLHFSSEQYDYIKYNGKIKTTEKGFNMRRDKYFYQKLAKHEDPFKFVLANIIDGDTSKWIGDLIKDEECDKIYKKWRRRQEALTYNFQQDLLELNTVFDTNFKIENNQHPELLRLFLANKISYETLVILDDLVQYSRIWNKKMAGDVIWEKLEIKLRKYKPFLSYDKEKLRKMILNDGRWS